MDPVRRQGFARLGSGADDGAVHRMGGVFVLPATINGGAKSYFIVDSGAANVQIPEEVAEEMKRNGTLTEADFLGQRRFILADGSGLQQRVFRLKTLQSATRRWRTSCPLSAHQGAVRCWVRAFCIDSTGGRSTT